MEVAASQEEEPASQLSVVATPQEDEAPATEVASQQSQGEAEAPKGDLASRVKSRGLQLPSDAPALSGAALGLSGGLAARGPKGLPTAPEHRPLEVTALEKRQLFTPLMQQGSSAMEEEKRRRIAFEQDRLTEVKATLRRWVQECLAREDKRKRFLEKGVLKCRVQAKWSEGLHDALKQLIAGYKGKLLADGEKDGSAEKQPAWLPRNERWLVAFDGPAFEAYMAAHPQVVEPPEQRVRSFAEDFVAGQEEPDPKKLLQLGEALEKQFGPLRAPLVERAKHLAEESILSRIRKAAAADAAKKDKYKKKPKPADAEAAVAAAAAAAAEKAAAMEKKRKEREEKEKKNRDGNKRPKVAQMESLADAAWAASSLAPLGMASAEAGSGERGPAVRVPSEVAGPLLEGLKALKNSPAFHDALRSTNVGKVVNAYRHHPSAEVAAAAKALLASWKAACRERPVAKVAPVAEVPAVPALEAPPAADEAMAPAELAALAEAAVAAAPAEVAPTEPEAPAAPADDPMEAAEAPGDAAPAEADEAMAPAEDEAPAEVTAAAEEPSAEAVAEEPPAEAAAAEEAAGEAASAGEP